MAKQKKKRWSDYLWIVSATYFTLGFFNIVFAWLGVICFLIPLLIAVFGGSKAYCNNYCGRGQLFLQIGNTLGWSRKKVAPRWLSSKWFRNTFLIFFLFFFVQMLFLTVHVAMGAASLHETIHLLWTLYALGIGHTPQQLNPGWHSLPLGSMALCSPRSLWVFCSPSYTVLALGVYFAQWET